MSIRPEDLAKRVLRREWQQLSADERHVEALTTGDPCGEETAALRAWALTIAARRGKRIAVVALARRLAGIVYAMWCDGQSYDATQLRMPRPRLAQAG